MKPPIRIKHCEEAGFVLEGVSPKLGHSYEFTIVINGRSAK